MADNTIYQTALDLKRTVPEWITDISDRDRVQAYGTYRDIYRNIKDAFKVVLRDDDGDEKSRRFVPAARTIIEATNRYLAKNPAITLRPLAVTPDGQEIQADPEALLRLKQLWENFAAREEFYTKFGSMKRWMLIRGDGVLHLTADDTKPEGNRLRLVELDPSSYFKIPDPLDTERVMGVYLVTLIADDDGELIAQRQEYKRQEDGKIWTQLRFFETDKWDDRWPLSEDDLAEVETPERMANMEALLTGFTLAPEITSIPVYLYRNRREGAEPYGVSELQGIETLLAGIIQTATDEDITMAQTGIGIYVTTSGSPKDDQGGDLPWIIAPASVLELQGKDDRFERVEGVDSVQPLLDHMNMLSSQARETTGTPDIAVGSVDVSVAESGIALAIQMAPILAKNEETELELKSVTEHLLYDLVNMWFPVYEGLPASGTSLIMTFDDPLPTDRTATLKEILDMVAAKVISIQYAQQKIKERLGYDIPEDMLAQIAEENQTLLDSVGGRLEEEAGAEI